ncbi:reverse transcriptase domain-containing protein [uncultured Chryseobacterium sp.]|uniref:reverse transcriptase domain-containing protein n=1 Tax=uncultured Chryseobacterium sp. TaxID=259322 RepID=UPI0025D77FC4|nr:reverse transcriptase domain-containing protein [uncultured Chryseobacterium sp.]
MATVSDMLKINCIQIIVSIGGFDPKYGSGVVYVTPKEYNYNYILTAKHNFEEEDTSINIEKILKIDLYYSDRKDFEHFFTIEKEAIVDSILLFDVNIDFLMIKIPKIGLEHLDFKHIYVSDTIKYSNSGFFSRGMFEANINETNKFDLEYNDGEIKRFKIKHIKNPGSIKGLSGAGVFGNRNSVLYGIIYKYPTENLENNTIDCVDITFSEINKQLRTKSVAILDSKYKRHYKDEVFDLQNFKINNTYLDLVNSVQMLRSDINDDWYHDPLKYIDLLNINYFFQYYKTQIGKKYKFSRAELFYVPKKSFTLRQAIISNLPDRLLYMAIVRKLAPIIDDAMLPNVYSARYNRFSHDQLILNGVEQWKKLKYKIKDCLELQDDLDSGLFKYNCLLKIDILNFYDNINKKFLIEKLKRICKNADESNAVIFLDDFLSTITNRASGIPQNSDASSLLATFYLNQVDVFMSNYCDGYFRFMDDVRILCKNKYEARKILQVFEIELRRCHLSINSEKTKILDFKGKDIRADYSKDLYSMEINTILRFRKSNNSIYKNLGFHNSINLINKAIAEEDTNDSETSARNLNFALSTITKLVRKKISINEISSNDFKNVIEKSIEILKDKPWITTNICNVLSLLSSETVRKDFQNELQDLVISENYNTYSFQIYQLWLLLAKHKCDSRELRQFATKQIEKNDETNRPVIAAMIIYMCSIDFNYKRVLIRKLNEDFTHGYFQERLVLIALRSFDQNLLPLNLLKNKSLKDSFKYTHENRDKDLVFIQGYNEDNENEYMELEQMYSI